MKKTVFVLFTCFLFACSDNDGLISVVDEPNPIAEELVPISFNMGFSKEEVPFRSTASGFTAKYLTFAVYKNNTSGLFYKQFLYVDSDGSINEMLPEGDYVFVFIANNTTYAQHYGIDLSTIAYPADLIYSPAYFSLGRVDQFYTKFNYTVKKENENTNLPVALNRIVGKIEIVLEDVTLDEAPAIVLSSDDLPGTEYYFTKTFDYVPSVQGMNPPTTATPFTEIYYPTSSPGLTISLYCYENINELQERYPVSFRIEVRSDPSDENTAISTKYIYDVDILKNKIVRYIGKIFASDSTPSFNISVSDTWGETIDDSF